MRTLFTGIVTDNAESLRKRYGDDLVCTPLIEIVPVNDRTDLCKAFRNEYDYILFTSRFAVAAVGDELKEYTTSHSKTVIVSIGDTTTAALRKAGICNVKQTDKDNSYGVIEWFARQTRGNVLIPRSNLALAIIPDGLNELGYNVTTATAYINQPVKEAKTIDLTDIERIVFTSPSTIDNFIALYGCIPDGKQIVTRGPVTEKHLREKMAAFRNKEYGIRFITNAEFIMQNS